MSGGIRNAYAYKKIFAVLESTETIILMAAFVIVAGCVTWIFMRGVYGNKIARLRYIIAWMTLTQLCYMSLFELVRGYFDAYDIAIVTALRICLWLMTGMVISLTPVVDDALVMSMRGRILFLGAVHIMMRFIVLAILGGLLVYGLHYPKILNKITHIVPACRDAAVCIIQNL